MLPHPPRTARGRAVVLPHKGGAVRVAATLSGYGVCYFLVQWPNRAKVEGALEMAPVSEPSSSEIVAFQVS
jgi:hypothetical protein